MLLSDRKLKSGSVLLALIAGLGLTMSACQVKPLYSTTSSQSGQTLSAELASIEIAPAKTRIEQEIRNNLIFAFTGGGQPATPAYRLEMSVSNSSGNLSIESGTGLAQTTRVRLTADYRLINLADNSVATNGYSFFTADYARSEQRFANDRAEIDAENRAAEQVANDIQLRLSAYLTTGIGTGLEEKTTMGETK